MPLSTPIPLPPSGTPLLDPATKAVSVQWQNYLLALENALASGVPPINAQYWVSTANSELTNERNIGVLSSGYLQIVTGAGIATPSTTPQIPATDLSGTLPVEHGGTGAEALAAHGVLIGNGAGAVVVTGAGTAGQVLTSNGASADPTFQAASSDYEEGSWTPVIGGAGGTSGQAYSIQVGRYVKIGNLAYVQCFVTLSTEGTITGNVQIQGLPFVSENTSNLFAVGAVEWASLATTWVNIIARIGANVQVAVVEGTTVAANQNIVSLTATDINDTSRFMVTMAYRATA